MRKPKKSYKVGSKNCIIKNISKSLDKQLRRMMNDVKTKNPKEKDKITYTWITDNVEVRLRK